MRDVEKLWSAPIVIRKNNVLVRVDTDKPVCPVCFKQGEVSELKFSRALIKPFHDKSYCPRCKHVERLDSSWANEHPDKSLSMRDVL